MFQIYKITSEELYTFVWLADLISYSFMLSSVPQCPECSSRIKLLLVANVSLCFKKVVCYRVLLAQVIT